MWEILFIEILNLKFIWILEFKICCLSKNEVIMSSQKAIVNKLDSQIQILSPSVGQYFLAVEANTFLSPGALIIKSHLQKKIAIK